MSQPAPAPAPVPEAHTTALAASGTADAGAAGKVGACADVGTAATSKDGLSVGGGPGDVRSDVVKRGTALVPALRARNGQFVASQRSPADDGSGLGDGTGQPEKKRRRPSEGVDGDKPVREEYEEFLRAFLLRGEAHDWVPFSSSVGPIVELYECLLHASKRLERGKRATLSRAFYSGGAPFPVDRLPRRQCIDPLTGYKARSRLFAGFRLPRPMTSDMNRVRSFIAKIKFCGRLAKCYSSVDEALGVCVKILSCFRHTKTARGYAGFPPVAEVDSKDRGSSNRPGRACGNASRLAGAQFAGGGSASYNCADIRSEDDANSAAGQRFVELATANGQETLRFDDAVEALIGFVKHGKADIAVDRDDVEGVLEDACGAESFRVDQKGFQAAFLILLKQLGLTKPLPDGARAQFLDAARPKDFIGSRVAARLIAKLVSESKLEGDGAPLRPAGLSLDIKEVRGAVREQLVGDLDEVRFEVFAKVTRNYLYGAEG